MSGSERDGGSGSTSSSPAPGSKERDRKSMRMDRFLEAAMSGGLVPKSGIERVPLERAPAARTRPHSTGGLKTRRPVSGEFSGEIDSVPGSGQSTFRSSDGGASAGSADSARASPPRGSRNIRTNVPPELRRIPLHKTSQSVGAPPESIKEVVRDDESQLPSSYEVSDKDADPTIQISCERLVENVHLRCCQLVGSKLWAGEWDGSITIRDPHTADEVGKIPAFTHDNAAGHHADEYVWSILQVRQTAWVGFSSGTIRIFDLTHVDTVRPHE